MSSGHNITTFLKSRLPDSATADVTGNASIEIKELPIKWLALLRGKGKGFSGPIVSRVKVTDVSILQNMDQTESVEAKVTCEVDVTPDMCNERGMLAEGCLVTLIDEGTNISMAVASAVEGRWRPIGVSQTINVFFHASTVVGVKLRLIHFSIASGSQTQTARCEIWDMTNQRLVASGAQLAVPPSKLEKKSSL